MHDPHEPRFSPEPVITAARIASPPRTLTSLQSPTSPPPAELCPAAASPGPHPCRLLPTSSPAARRTLGALSTLLWPASSPAVALKPRRRKIPRQASLLTTTASSIALPLAIAIPEPVGAPPRPPRLGLERRLPALCFLARRRPCSAHLQPRCPNVCKLVSLSVALPASCAGRTAISVLQSGPTRP